MTSSAIAQQTSSSAWTTFTDGATAAATWIRDTSVTVGSTIGNGAAKVCNVVSNFFVQAWQTLSMGFHMAKGFISANRRECAIAGGFLALGVVIAALYNRCRGSTTESAGGTTGVDPTKKA